MAKGANQKLKLMYLTKIFMECTDDEHGLSTQEIIAKLKQYDVNADRKTLYLDFEELKRFGIDIVKVQAGRDVLYHVASRDFELPELKLLVDSVQSAKFITEHKSAVLIKKLENLVSKYEAVQLNRQVIISGRIKSMNESIYYNVDKIHTAIGRNSQIRFRYFRWTVDKKQEFRHGGAFYNISPWALVWDDENYYMIGYDAAENKIKHYRVDKMKEISVTDSERLGREAFEAKNIPTYSRKLFGMFGGDTEYVTIEASNDKAGIFIDRFGKDIHFIKLDPEHFSLTVEVEVSDLFLGWIFALGKDVRITAPASVVDRMHSEAQRLIQQYTAEQS